MIFAPPCVIAVLCGVERTLGGANKQTQNQGGQSGNHAGNHLHGVLGSIAQMMLRQQALQEQAKQSSAEDAPGAN